MADVKIKVDRKQVESIGAEFREMVIEGLHRTVERGLRYLRQEAPKVTHNLEQGMSADVDEQNLRAELKASARSGRPGAQGGLLHLPSGATREITLRSQPAFDYAEAVARGTGVFGPKGSVIRPKAGKALLIPVGSVPPAINGKPQAYITSNGKIYVLRRFSRGRRADPYDVRAAQRLEADVPKIWDAVVQAFADGKKEF
jgi:hypothetical protein